MILQRLAGLYERLLHDCEVEPPGLQRKEIPFVVVLDRDGCFVELIDTREADAKGRKQRGRFFTVPQDIGRSGVSPAANLLWDTVEFVFGIPRSIGPISERLRADALARQQRFIERLEQLPEEIRRNAGVAAVLIFLKRGDYNGVTRHAVWQELRAVNGIVTFKLADSPFLVCEHPNLRDALSSIVASGDEQGGRAQCLVTGEEDDIARLHPFVKGVRGARPSGAKVVSFDDAAFRSYGLQQGNNAPVGRRAASAYAAALNWLLSRRPGEPAHSIVLGDATYVFWAERRHSVEDVFAGFLDEPPPAPRSPDGTVVRQVYQSPRTGLRPFLDDDTQFYVLGLAPNNARLSIRYWRHTTVAEIAERVIQHFDDIEIVAPEVAEPASLRRLLRALAVQGKDENVPPLLAGAVLASALGGGAYPRTLLATAVGRARAEQGVTRARAALMKAWLAREARLTGTPAKEVGVSLDPENRNIGYRLGRLFAVLENVQRTALGRGINATIRDRFYGAASATPVAAFPQLMRLKNHHLGSVRRDRGGLAEWYERQIGEVMEALVEVPPFLTLEDQGRFAVGYYHQRQHRETPKETNDA
jgi:CRISPR-associated protein Csd1